jgi:1-acyl-sn-glycerol-3-phosphate acyltransferase
MIKKPLICNNELYTNEQNPNLIINNMCFCQTYFTYNKDKISLLLPCSHFVHEKCINEYLFTDILNIKNLLTKIQCPICKTDVNNIITEDKIYKDKKLTQYKIDLDSVKLPNFGDSSYLYFPFTVLKLNTFLNKLIISETETDLLDTLELFLRTANIKINIIDNTHNNPIKYNNGKVSWLKKRDIMANKVLISNHSHYLDSFVLYYLFKSGFVAGEFINKTDIGKIIASKCNLLIFDRNKDTNMVEKIKKYLQEKKIITIFPEGAQSNQHTLLKFRTGAFYTNSPVCPIIIKYNPYIWDDDIKNLIMKIFTQNQIVIDVIINDLVYPPFDINKINNVRNFMADIGQLKLSRVSNKAN